MAYITDVIQETHIGIGWRGRRSDRLYSSKFFGAMPPNGRADMILDRPFIYGIITHDDTILFIGVCENPAES